jgi:hypothetical protein
MRKKDAKERLLVVGTADNSRPPPRCHGLSSTRTSSRRSRPEGDRDPGAQRRSGAPQTTRARSGLQRVKFLVKLGEVILPRRVLRRARDELYQDCPARLQPFARFYRVFLRDIGRAEF